MQRLDWESRRYRRLQARLPARVWADAPALALDTCSIDVSTGGGSFDVPGGQAACHIGERVRVSLVLEEGTPPFQTVGTIRHLTILAPQHGAPITMRIGVQFSEALLLSRVPDADRAG